MGKGRWGIVAFLFAACQKLHSYEQKILSHSYIPAYRYRCAGQISHFEVLCRAHGFEPTTLVGLRRVCHVWLAFFESCQYGIGLSSGPICFVLLLLAWLGLGLIVIIRFRPRGLVYLLYVIKSPQSSMPIACDIVACGSITDIKSALTEKALQIFCKKYHIPDELSVIGAAKVSHFEVLCRAHGFEPTVGLFRCLYVNSKNKGRISFSKRPGNDAVCYTKPLDSLKNWNDRFFWVDAFACPALFPWNTSKSVPKDPFPKSSEFNAEHYATLVAHPAPFHKYPEPFLCLVGISRYYTLDENTYPQFLRDDDEEMDLLSFIRTADPTKVRIGERQRGEDEPKLLDTTVGRTVPLLPVAPARAESELDASVDRLFDEGGSGTQAEQGDSAGGGDEQDIVIQPVITVVTTAAEDVIPLQPRRPKKRKTTVSDAGGSSHPPKKLREDHETLSGASVGGKSKSVVQQLLAGAVQNVVVRGEPIPTLPFVTSSVSATPEREEEDHTDSLAGANLRTIGAPQRFVISSDSSHHSGANIAEAEADSFIRPSVPLMTMTTTVTSTVDPTTTAKEKLVESSVFGDGSSSGADHTVGGFSGLLKVYVPQWSVTNGSRLDDGRTCREMVDEFAPPRFFASIRGMEHDQLFTEFNVGAARQMSLSAEVRMRAEFNIREKRRLSAVVEEKNLLLKTRDEEVANLKAQLLVKEAEATEAIRLRAEVQTLADRNIVLEREKGELDIKVADLAATVKVREQEVADLDAMVTSVKFHNDNLTDQVRKLEASSAILQDKVTAYDNFMGQLEKFQDDRIRDMNKKFNKLDTDLLTIAKCLNSTEYLSSLGAAIGKAVEKGMQEGLSAEIIHGAVGRVLTDVAAYNPSAEADYLSALQRLQSVNFSLISEMKSNKDASVDTVHKLETSSAVLQDKVTAYDSLIGQLEKFQDDRIREMNEKLNKLDADLVELALHLEEKFYPHLLTTISGRRWLLTHGLELAIAKCLNSTEYLSSLGAAIGKAIEKGMQEGLSAGIIHGAAGRVLTDVAAYNPSAEADYLSALQRLQSVNFPLISELKSNKDASVDTIMNLLRLEDSLAERLDLTESQPHVDQLMVPIHHSPDQTVVGATSLLFSLDVSRNRVRRIKENIANDRSALYDVFVPLAEPLSIAALEGTAGISGTAPGTTTALSMTFASTSTIPPISTDDYEFVHTDYQEGTDADEKTGTGADANPFPSIDDAELNVPE
ncbi:hypothetical protein Tco_1492434 [Tanacetum coccineum]